MKKTIILFVLFVLFCPCYVSAVEVLTWDSCLREAGRNHPELISATENLKQVKADKKVTISSVLPQISSEAGRTRNGSKVKNSSGQTVSTTTDNYSYGITAQQLLFDGFKTTSDINAASENINASQFDFNVVSSNVRLAVRSAFVGLLRAQKLIDITKDIAVRRKQNLDMVKLRYEAGTEHEGSLLTAEADLQQAEFEIVQAERNVLLAQRQLVNELGRNGSYDIEVNGEFALSETDRGKPDFDVLADNTPFLRELISKKESAKYGLKSAKGDFFPQIYLNGSLGKSAAEWPPDGEKWSAGVSLSLPIFEGGSNIAKFFKAKSELVEAEADVESGRDDVLYTLEEAWNDFQNKIDKIYVQRKYLEAAEKRAKIANAEYSSGLISFDDWIIIEDNLVSQKKSFLDAQSNMLIAEAAWIQAKGGVLDYES